MTRQTPLRDELLLAAVGNYADYLARKVQANSNKRWPTWRLSRCRFVQGGQEGAQGEVLITCHAPQGGLQTPLGVLSGLRPHLSGVQVRGGAPAGQHHLAAHQPVPLQLFLSQFLRRRYLRSEEGAADRQEEEQCRRGQENGEGQGFVQVQKTDGGQQVIAWPTSDFLNF